MENHADPPSPIAIVTPPFAPAARRTLSVFGAAVELVLVPDRAQRHGVPAKSRPAFRPSPAPRILREETVWRGNGLAVTPNRYPFAKDHALLWRETPGREHGEDLLRTLCAWADRHGGTGIANSIGASATIPRAHAHLTSERLPFLAALPEEPLAAPFLPAVSGARWVCKRVPFWLLGVRGDPGSRATALSALQENRTTAAWNAVVQDGTAWIYPRSPVEIPAPWFPWALGGAELWGRWCFVEAEAFAAATGSDLEQALVAAGMPAETPPAP